MHIIAGLGNPGAKYKNTRHNAGFMVIDYLSELYRIEMKEIKYKAIIGRGIIQGEEVILVKPQTFMNNSGESLIDVLKKERVSIDNLLVIYDDMDIEKGKIRLKPKGSAGTHNGMKSIIYHLKEDAFPRLRIGVGKPLPEEDTINYVLGKFVGEEREIITKSIEKAAISVSAIVVAGISPAMNKYNG